MPDKKETLAGFASYFLKEGYNHNCCGTLTQKVVELTF
jgi:hypothetical protein